MFQLPQPVIAPSEALLATIGIKPVISRNVEKVHKYQLQEAQNLGKQVTKLAKDLVHGKLEDSYTEDLDYKSMLKDLARGFQIRQVQQMLSAFPAQYRSLAGGFVMLASSLATELQKMYPISTYATVTGSINQLPSDLAFWSYVNVLEVLNDPLTVFPLMATGALLRKQAAAVRLVYPTLSAAIDAAIFQATVSAKSNKQSFELDARAEIGVKAWFGKAPLPTSLLQHMQANHANAKQRPQQPAPPSSLSQNVSYAGSPSEQADNNPR